MTCAPCEIITQLYIPMRWASGITNVARHNATLNASALFSHPPATGPRRTAQQASALGIGDRPLSTLLGHCATLKAAAQRACNTEAQRQATAFLDGRLECLVGRPQLRPTF